MNNEKPRLAGATMTRVTADWQQPVTARTAR